LKVSKYLIASDQAVEVGQYPGFRVLVAIVTTFAACSAGAEKSFSLMNIIKTEQRCINFM